MKLISNRIRTSTDATSEKPQDVDEAEQRIAKPQPNPEGTGLSEQKGKEGDVSGDRELSPAKREERSERAEPIMGSTAPSGGSTIAGRGFSASEAPAPASSSGSSDTSQPPPAPVAESHLPATTGRHVGPEAGFHHEITWQMLRLLAAHGKVKAADGSELLVSLIGQEPPLGDIFQIESTSPDMEKQNMAVVLLASEEMIEVLGGQELVVIDSAPFQVHRQPVTTSLEVAQAMFDVQEIELRRMGVRLLNAAHEMLRKMQEEQKG